MGNSSTSVGEPVMTSAEWDQHCAKVKDAMATYVGRFITPISMSPEYGKGVAWATGSYLNISGITYLLSNAHVFLDVPSGSCLAHLPGPTDDYIKIQGQPDITSWPIDAACVQVHIPLNESSKKSVPETLLEPCFAPIQSELLFWMGFPGFTAERHEPPTEARQHMTRFDGPLEMLALPMLTQITQDWDGKHQDFDPQKHVALHYPSQAQREASGPFLPLPNPKGMSGSLLWDTKYVATQKSGRQWAVEDARVCGLLWAAISNPDLVFVTKIEEVRGSLAPLREST